MAVGPGIVARRIEAAVPIAIRDDLDPGDSSVLVSKGITYGTLSRNLDGSWDTTAVEGLRPDALASSGPADPPSLIIAPFHQAGAVVSLRQFSVNAFNQHHGIQATERFGQGTDPDGDGFTDEMTVADVTAVSIWQATLPVPGQVIPDDDVIEAAIVHGEELFADLGCSDCHVPALPLRGPIDVVGAGDTATATLALALAAQATLREAMELAQAAASLVVHQLGTTGVAKPAEMRQLLFP